MLIIKVGDITKLKDVDVIVNAANGRSPMGRGVALAIKEATGIGEEVKTICKEAGGYKAGECYISSAGKLQKRGIKHIYHCVTMEFPGGLTSLDTVAKGMRTTLSLAMKNEMKSIAFPGLGTGIGCLNKQQVASKMVQIAQEYCDYMDVTIIDLDKEFISYVESFSDVENQIIEDSSEEETESNEHQ